MLTVFHLFDGHYQARNNARMVVAGSVEMFTDKSFDAVITVKGQMWVMKTSLVVGSCVCEGMRRQSLERVGETTH